MALNPEPNLLKEDTHSVTHWGLTQTKLVKCSYTWTIDNFKFCCAELIGQQVVLMSPNFCVVANNTTVKWRLDLGRNLTNGEHLSLYLQLVSCGKNGIKACYKFSIINAERKEINVKGLHYFRHGIVNGFDNFIQRETLLEQAEDLLPNDRLTIRCEVSILVDRISSCEKVGVPDEPKVVTRCLSDDICNLFDDMTLSDVTLVAGGKEIHAHKVILAARSKVFSAMFQHDMQEQKLSRVDITDVEHDVLTEMLRYIYTDRAPNLDKVAADLLVAADKYGLDGLKVMCEEPLCKSLSVETAADLLVLADLHSVVRLKEQAITFINSHATDMEHTPGWNNIISSHPRLVSELFLALTVQQRL